MDNINQPYNNESDIRQIFDKIAFRYDLLNRVLSFGLDRYWRSRAADIPGKGLINNYLDIAAGTGDLLTAVMTRHPEIKNCVALDASSQMLDICKKKMRKRRLLERVELVKGDMRKIPFGDNTFDTATVGFGIRNTRQVECTLGEILRVLSVGGKAVVMEFAMPTNFLVRGVYLFYFRHVLVILAWILSGNFGEYRYLNRTVEQFYKTEEFCQLMQDAGFQNVGVEKLTFGIVNIYHGIKGK